MNHFAPFLIKFTYLSCLVFSFFQLTIQQSPYILLIYTLLFTLISVKLDRLLLTKVGSALTVFIEVVFCYVYYYIVTIGYMERSAMFTAALILISGLFLLYEAVGHEFLLKMLEKKRYYYKIGNVYHIREYLQWRLSKEKKYGEGNIR